MVSTESADRPAELRSHHRRTTGQDMALDGRASWSSLRTILRTEPEKVPLQQTERQLEQWPRRQQRLAAGASGVMLPRGQLELDVTRSQNVVTLRGLE